MPVDSCQCCFSKLRLYRVKLDYSQPHVHDHVTVKTYTIVAIVKKLKKIRS